MRPEGRIRKTCCATWLDEQREQWTRGDLSLPLRPSPPLPAPFRPFEESIPIPLLSRRVSARVTRYRDGFGQSGIQPFSNVERMRSREHFSSGTPLATSDDRRGAGTPGSGLGSTRPRPSFPAFPWF